MSVAAPSFAGFTREGIQFLADLAANNDRAWFAPRKGDYERLLREPMEQLCLALSDRLTDRGIPLRADPKRSPFRIYRDTRFSRDKSPYKTHLGASFPWVLATGGGATGGASDGGAPATTATTAPTGGDEGPHGNGGYFHFQPGEMYLGGGMWMPPRPRLEAFRQAVLADEAVVRSAIEDPAFVATFGGVRSHDELRRVPPGYPADHPLAHLFRWKDVVFSRRLSDAEVTSPALPDLIADGFVAAMPVFRFLASLRG